MRAGEIKDAESLQAWLESLPRETEAQRETARRWAVTIAHRAAMRVLPVATEWRETDNEQTKWLKFADLRTALISDVSKVTNSYELRIAADASAWPVTTTGFRSLALAGSCAFHFDAFSYSIDCLKALSVLKISDDFWKLVESDIDFLSLYGLSNDWAVAISTDAVSHSWINIRQKILAQGGGWRFWVEWYENTLYGRPQDYDLLTKIALIDPADWDKGADHVNALIQRIVEQHNLAKDARALKEEIAQLKERLQSVEHRSHNNPPKLVDETAAAQKEVTIIWAALDEAEQELEKPDPDPSVLARIGAFLKTAAVSIVEYCVALSDVAVKASVGVAAATGTAKALASQSDQLKAFGEALLQFAKTLGGP